MEARFVTEATGKYFVLPKEKEYESYKEKMLRGSCIKGLMPLTVRYINNEGYYYYDTKDFVHLDEYLNKHRLKEENYKKIFENLAEMQEEMANYLLTWDGLVTAPEWLYVDEKDERLWFAYYPQNTEEVNNFSRLAEMFISAAADDDEIAMRFACEFYEMALSGKQDILQFLNTVYCENAQAETVSENVIEEHFLTEESGDSYYFTDTQKEEERSDITIIKAVIICAVLIVISGAGYALIYMNPWLMELLGIAPESYIMTGGIMAAVLTLMIVFIIQSGYKKNKLDEEKRQQKEYMEGTNPIAPGTMEYEEFMALVDTNVDKVLKSE